MSDEVGPQPQPEPSSTDETAKPAEEATAKVPHELQPGVELRVVEDKAPEADK